MARLGRWTGRAAAVLLLVLAVAGMAARGAFEQPSRAQRAMTRLRDAETLAAAAAARRDPEWPIVELRFGRCASGWAWQGGKHGDRQARRTRTRARTKPQTTLLPEIGHRGCLTARELADGWEAVGPDINLGAGGRWAAGVHLYARRAPAAAGGGAAVAAAAAVRDVHVGRDRPSSRHEHVGGNLWILHGPYSRDEVVMGVDILHGADAAELRPGWRLLEQPIALRAIARLSVRHGPARTFPYPRLSLPPSGRFKVLQISDLHLSTGPGVCRDISRAHSPRGGCLADRHTLQFVAAVIDDEKPDLLVFTGDQINGETAPNAKTALFKFASLGTDRRIPYATVLGNHDDEGDMSRSEILDVLAELPYSLSRHGMREVDGEGNYFVSVHKDESQDIGLGFFFLDTHKYSPDEIASPGYDWLKPSQMLWMRCQHRLLAPWPSDSLLATFIHIPLPDVREELPILGEYREASTAPLYNSKFRDVLAEQDIMVLSAGHDHANDFCALSGWEKDGSSRAWLCQAGGAGLGGYGGYHNYMRRVRVFDFDLKQGRIKTWKRVLNDDPKRFGTASADRLDEQTLVDNRQVVTSEVDRENLEFAYSESGEPIWGFHRQKNATAQDEIA